MNDAGRDHGQIRAFSNRTYDPATALPTVVMRNEDYGRISRLLADGRAVELEFDIVNRIYPEGGPATTPSPKFPARDKADEVVMLGGHLDSWHAATGATDNAIGCAVMMEAARILAAIGVKPRRTIRVALWSGEEQGLLGSQAYVREHFGTFEDPKPEFAKFAGYFNIDSGTGRARGMTVFGPPAAADGPSRGHRTVQGPGRPRRHHDPQPSARRLRPHVVQRGRAAGHRRPAGSDSIQLIHVAHQPRHLRADRRGGCGEVGDRDRGGRVSPGDARRAVAAILQRGDAIAAAAAANDSAAATDESAAASGTAAQP